MAACVTLRVPAGDGLLCGSAYPPLRVAAVGMYLLETQHSVMASSDCLDTRTGTEPRA
jgi:hypothetical protein